MFSLPYQEHRQESNRSRPFRSRGEEEAGIRRKAGPKARFVVFLIVDRSRTLSLHDRYKSMHIISLTYDQSTSELHIRYTSMTPSEHYFAPKVCHICATEIRVKVPAGRHSRSGLTIELTELMEENLCQVASGGDDQGQPDTEAAR